MDDLLSILHTEARTSVKDLARQTGRSEAEVEEQIAAWEADGTIRGYHAILSDAVQAHRVQALIEVSVTPEREGGFDHIARRIGRFDEVVSMYLVSGGYDLGLRVEGNDLREVASFVSEKLATLPGVNRTATHFLLKTYKSRGVLMEFQDEHRRLQVSP